MSWCGNITVFFSTCGEGRPRRRKEERRGGEAGAAAGLSQPTEVSQPSMLCDSSKAPPLGDVIGRIFSLMPCWGPAAELPDPPENGSPKKRPSNLLRSQLKKSSTEAVSEKLVGEKKLRRGPASKITISPGSPGGGGVLTFSLRHAIGADLE